MNFNDFSIHEFCECVYGISDKCSTKISGLDMFSFIKSKTNNFDLTLFEFLRKDVRSFFDYIECEVEDPQKHLDAIDDKLILPSTDSSTATPPHNESFIMSRNNMPEQVKVYEVLYDQIEEKERSLREKIELLSKLYNFIIGFKNNIVGILEFSDLVEKEYQKTIESEKLNHLPVGNKIKLNELSSRELIEYCFEQEVPELEIYEYVKLKTDNFESNKVTIFKKELFRFIHKVKISITEEWTDVNKTYSEEYKHSLLRYLDKFIAKNTANSNVEELINEIRTSKENNDLRLAFSIAKKIDPTVRKTVSYYSFDYILRIIEENVTVKPNDKIKQNKIIKTKDESKLTYSEVALLCIYQGIKINQLNGNDILQSLGLKGSARRLLEKYNYYLIPNNRKSITETKADDFHLKRMIEVINYLKRNNIDSSKAEEEFDIFQKNLYNNKL